MAHQCYHTMDLKQLSELYVATVKVNVIILIQLK